MNITHDEIRPWSSEDDITENTLIIIEDGQPKELIYNDGEFDVLKFTVNLNQVHHYAEFEAFLNQVDELISTDELYTFSEVTV